MQPSALPAETSLWLVKEGFVLAHSEETIHLVGKSLHGDHEAAAHIAFTIRKLREMNAGAQLTFPFNWSQCTQVGYLSPCVLLLKIPKSEEFIYQISLKSSHCAGLAPIFLVLTMKTGCSYNRVAQKCQS